MRPHHSVSINQTHTWNPRIEDECLKCIQSMTMFIQIEGCMKREFIVTRFNNGSVISLNTINDVTVCNDNEHPRGGLYHICQILKHVGNKPTRQTINLLLNYLEDLCMTSYQSKAFVDYICGMRTILNNIPSKKPAPEKVEEKN